MPEENRVTFVETFRREYLFPDFFFTLWKIVVFFLCRKLGKESNLRVLWKWGGEMEGKPENVLLRDWLPQQDVLGKVYYYFP